MCRSLLLVVSLALACPAAARAQAPSGATRTARHHDTRTAVLRHQPRAAASPQASAADIARAYLTENPADFGLAAADVADVAVASVTTSGHSGVTHVYLRQRFNDIDVHGADMNVNVTRDGAILGAGTSFVPNLRAAISGTTAGLDAERAGAAAAAHLGRPIRAVTSATLVYEPLATGEVALAWLLTIEEAEGNHLWQLSVDASTGALFEQMELTVHDLWPEPEWAGRAASAAFVSGAVSAGDSTAAAFVEPIDAPLATVPVAGVPGSGTYKVFAWPSADPNDGPRSIVVDPADAISSPFGWHDIDGLPGPDSEQTVGNNVEAYVDILNDNVPVVADRATGVGGVFDFPLDLSADPSIYKGASITNLFYWSNFIHDVTYRYGFTEDAGNFQANNYGRGFFDPAAPPPPADSLRAEAQDGAGMDNSNFTTPADDALFPRPRMQVFNWVPVGGYEVQVQSGVPGNYPAIRANFRPFLADSAVTQPTAEVRLASPASGCSPFVGFPAGAIAYVEGNTCTALTKVTNARNAGAIGVIINTGLTDTALATSAPLAAPTTAGAGIPALGISVDTAAILRPALPLVAKLAFVGTPAPLRDGDLDAVVILHEYAHGISNRLTGGRTNVSCLANPEQMGEGWSDWLALALTDDRGRPDPRSRGIGPYLRFTGGDGAGVRPTRYSPDLSIDPVTYGSIGSGPLAVAVRTGYAWASMLWDVYWNLTDKHGFNPNVYDTWTTGGNNLAIQLVMDGMKLQPCRPGFVDGRNAVLQADQVLTGGANQCAIWRGFAKRGLGFSASQGSPESVTDGAEAFDLPAACQPRLVVTPAALDETLVQNRSASEPMQIRSVSEDAAFDLNWTITEALSDCSAPVDLPWVSASPASGIAPGNGSSDLAITYSAAGLQAGTYAGKLCIVAAGAATVEVPVSLRVQYDFRGFDGELAERPPRVDAGDEVKVKFSLTGFQGLQIFAAGEPSSRRVSCVSGTPLGAFEAAIVRRRTTLEYDPLNDEYRWRWQTSGSWAETCREFSLGLADGSVHAVRVRFED